MLQRTYSLVYFDFPISLSCTTCVTQYLPNLTLSLAALIHPVVAASVCHESNWAQRSCRDAAFARCRLKEFRTMADFVDCPTTSSSLPISYRPMSATTRFSAGDLPGLINSVHNALLNVTSGKVEVPAEPLKPVVPVKKSITPDYIICLEDGKNFKSLKRHLRTQYNLSPEDYREKWACRPTTRWSPRTMPPPARSSPSRWASASSAAARAGKTSESHRGHRKASPLTRAAPLRIRRGHAGLHRRP